MFFVWVGGYIFKYTCDGTTPKVPPLQGAIYGATYGAIYCMATTPYLPVIIRNCPVPIVRLARYCIAVQWLTY